MRGAKRPLGRTFPSQIIKTLLMSAEGVSLPPGMGSIPTSPEQQQHPLSSSLINNSPAIV